MKKRVVLITGASSGIGLATCKKFFEQGWFVIGMARRALSKPEFISRYIQGDVSNPGDLDKVCSSIVETEKRLDCLVNNAACQICKPLVETTIEEWDQVYAANVRGPFLLAKSLYKLLAASKGTIVNVASVHALATSANIAAYASSKTALVGLTRNMAIEFAEVGIRVNAVLPGAVDTPMLRAGLKRGHLVGANEDELINALGDKHIVGRVGQPQEIAEAIYFMANQDKISFLTGQTLTVDGGVTVRLSSE